jgi:signal transduction histidine kinase
MGELSKVAGSTQLSFWKRFSARTYILGCTILFILVPVIVLTYIGFQSVSDRRAMLEFSYQGTLDLVRDRIESEVIRKEESLRVEADQLRPQLTKSDVLHNWLHRIDTKHPWLNRSFLVRPKGNMISANLSLGWQELDSPPATGIFSTQSLIKAAEYAEFAGQNLSRAIRLYSEASTRATQLDERAFLLARVGRCRFKQEEYRKGLEDYKRLLELSRQGAIVNGIPGYVVAFSQLADGHAALGDQEARVEVLLEFSEHLLEHPWDVHSGIHRFYTSRTSQQLSKYTSLLGSERVHLSNVIRKLQERENALLEESRELEWIQNSLAPTLRPYLVRESPDYGTKHTSIEFEGSLKQFGYFRIAPQVDDPWPTVLGYRISEDGILSSFLPEILSGVNLGNDIEVGLVDNSGSLRYSQTGQSVPNFLVSTPFSSILPGWKAVLLHRDGESIEGLVSREKNIYLAIMLGSVLIMVIGVFFTVRAVTHEMELSEMRSDFVSRISHELKTPLSLIRMFGETLETGIVEDEGKRQEFYRIIRQESERLTHLINNVLDFSKIEVGNEKYSFQVRNVAEVVRHVLEAYRLHIRDCGFEFETSFPEDPPKAKIDSDAISQALLNLLDNATKYSQERKSIRVEVKSDSDWVSISVRDQGCGISDAELPEIFGKFYRGRDSSAAGSGLGLTLVKHIVEAHRGTIKVKSTEGRGSTFTLQIPAASEDVRS